MRKRIGCGKGRPAMYDAPRFLRLGIFTVTQAPFLASKSSSRSSITSASQARKQVRRAV